MSGRPHTEPTSLGAVTVGLLSRGCRGRRRTRYAGSADVSDACGLEAAAQRDTVEQAYQVFRKTSAPFIVSVAAQMLPD